jgi:hypothetical protein
VAKQGGQLSDEPHLRVVRQPRAAALTSAPAVRPWLVELGLLGRGGGVLARASWIGRMAGLLERSLRPRLRSYRGEACGPYYRRGVGK